MESAAPAPIETRPFEASDIDPKGPEHMGHVPDAVIIDLGRIATTPEPEGDTPATIEQSPQETSREVPEEPTFLEDEKSYRGGETIRSTEQSAENTSRIKEGIAKARDAVKGATSRKAQKKPGPSDTGISENKSKAKLDLDEVNDKTLSEQDKVLGDMLDQVRSGQLAVVDKVEDAVDGSSVTANRVAKAIEAREEITDQQRRRSAVRGGSTMTRRTERAGARQKRQAVAESKKEFENFAAQDRRLANPSEADPLEGTGLTGERGHDRQVLQEARNKATKSLGGSAAKAAEAARDQIGSAASATGNAVKETGDVLLQNAALAAKLAKQGAQEKSAAVAAKTKEALKRRRQDVAEEAPLPTPSKIEQEINQIIHSPNGGGALSDTEQQLMGEKIRTLRQVADEEIRQFPTGSPEKQQAIDHFRGIVAKAKKAGADVKQAGIYTPRTPKNSNAVAHAPTPHKSSTDRGAPHPPLTGIGAMEAAAAPAIAIAVAERERAAVEAAAADQWDLGVEMTADAIERRNGSPEVALLNDAAELHIYGSRGRTYTNPETGAVIADAAHPIKGKIEEIRENRRYGTTEAERTAAAEAYEWDVNMLLVADELEPAQAAMIMDLREEDNAGKGQMIGRLIASGVDPVEAKNKAETVYRGKDKEHLQAIKDVGLNTREEYDGWRAARNRGPGKSGEGA